MTKIDSSSRPDLDTVDDRQGARHPGGPSRGPQTARSTQTTRSTQTARTAQTDTAHRTDKADQGARHPSAKQPEGRPELIVRDDDGALHLNYPARQSHWIHKAESKQRLTRLSDHIRQEGFGKAAWGFIRNHLFLAVLIVLTIATSLAHGVQTSKIDWHILAVLFQLMVAIEALERYGILSWISLHILNRCKSERGLSIAMGLLALFLAMFATNDVTILTLIPLILVMKKRTNINMYVQMTMVTICANLGSCLTPFGNPHNLYIYTHYHLSVGQFMGFSLPLFIVSVVLILVMLAFVPKKPIDLSRDEIPRLVRPQRAIPFVLVFIAFIVNLHVNTTMVSVTCILFACLMMLVFDPRIIFHINWNLLLTLFFIFICIGNVANMAFLQDAMHAIVHSPLSTYVSGLLFSQVISNVPITVLLAQFTQQTPAFAAGLFYGADIGGLGSPIASLANLITISLHRQEFPGENGRFLQVFLGINFAALAFLGVLFGVLIGTGVLA